MDSHRNARLPLNVATLTAETAETAEKTLGTRRSLRALRLNVTWRRYVNENAPVESPNCSTSVNPIACISDSITFAIGVPAGALR